jgi:hypothetical protein
MHNWDTGILQRSQPVSHKAEGGGYTMNYNENPVHTRGDKNVFCPYYDNCLDHAVELHWECWTCQHCQHNRKAFVEEVMFLTKDPDPYYSFSPYFHKKAAHILL